MKHLEPKKAASLPEEKATSVPKKRPPVLGKRSSAPERKPGTEQEKPSDAGSNAAASEEAFGIERKKHKLLNSKAVRTRKIVRMKSGVDRPFLIIVILLLCIGTTMVFSSSYVFAKHNYNGDSYYFVRKQLEWALFSLLGMFFVANIDYLIVKKFSKAALIVSFAFLFAVLFVGKRVNGAIRWIDLGFVQIQPSEIAKAATVLFFSDYIVKHQRDMKQFKVGVMPFMLVFLGNAILLYFEPHLSAMIILLLLTAAMMYMGGTRKLYLGLLGGAGIVGVGVISFFTSHGRDRIVNWLNPEMDPSGKGWQPLQSLYAIGSGGVWGKGLGQSTQKHLWLPEPQNDYIFAVLCEEMGFVFAAAVIVLFVVLIWRGFYIAKHAPTQYATLVVLGLILQIAIQVILNIAVVTNTLPSTGVSLPFFSYGGSSLFLIMLEMGLILNISRFSYLEKG